MGFLWFILGAVVGAVVMLFVYRNNNKKMTKLAEGLDRELREAKDKIVQLTKEKENKE